MRGVSMRIGMTMAAAGAALLSMATPAAAQPAGAWAACQAAMNWGPALKSSVSFTVDGRTRRQQVGVSFMREGDYLLITASGSVHNGSLGHWRGPNGEDNSPAPAHWPGHGVNRFALYGEFRDGADFHAGTNSGCVRVGRGQDVVFVGVNDDVHHDNAGSFQVRARLYR